MPAASPSPESRAEGASSLNARLARAGQPLRRLGPWAVLGLVMLYGTCVNGRYRLHPDSALFVMMSRTLGAAGGPTDAWGDAVVGAPRGMAWLIHAAGGPGVAVQLVMILSAGVAAALTFGLMRLALGRAAAWAVTLLLLSNRAFFESSLHLLSELPFTAGLMVYLLGAELRRGGRPAAGWVLLLVGTLTMGAFRSVVAVVLAASLVAEVVGLGHRHRRRSAAVGVLGHTLLLVTVALMQPAVRQDLRVLQLHAVDSLGRLTQAGPTEYSPHGERVPDATDGAGPGRGGAAAGPFDRGTGPRFAVGSDEGGGAEALCRYGPWAPTPRHGWRWGRRRCCWPEWWRRGGTGCCGGCCPQPLWCSGCCFCRTAGTDCRCCRWGWWGCCWR